MQSLGRALTLLAELSKHDRPLTLAELSESVGLHKSTVHRMLATFIEHGLVRRDEAQRYMVGMQAFELARAAHGQAVPSTVVTKALNTLREGVGATACYAVPQGRHMVTTALETGVQGVADEVGGCLELYSTAVGKAYLAYRPRVEVDDYVAYAPFPPMTRRTIIDGEGLLRALASVRRNGYSVEDGEHERTMRAVGAPVLDRQGHAIAAVSVSLPATVRSDNLQSVSAAVMAAAGEIQCNSFGVVHPRLAMRLKRLTAEGRGA